MARFTCVCLILFVSVCAQAQRGPVQRYSDLRLNMTAPSAVALGHNPRFRVTLSNTGNEPVRVPTLRSPEALRFVLYFQYPDGRKGQTGPVSLVGQAVHTTNSAGMRVWMAVPKRIEGLAPHGYFRETIDLQELEPYPRAGHYRLRVIYDEVLAAEVRFQVTFVPERDMPRIIEMAASESWNQRHYANALLLTVVSRSLFEDYYPAPNDSMSKIRAESTAIRTWWEQNKSLLHVEAGRLVSRYRSEQ
jgi:hypothetical protein